MNAHTTHYTLHSFKERNEGGGGGEEVEFIYILKHEITS
jgi:hypothetical protein